MIDTDMCHREPVSVRVEELIRAFEDDHLNFDIPAGRMTGFVGADGAGKTTTMRMIVGVLKPTSGQVLWSGRPITAEDRRTIGYMPEERGLIDVNDGCMCSRGHSRTDCLSHHRPPVVRTPSLSDRRLNQPEKTPPIPSLLY